MWWIVALLVGVFFFQAEDGIRDLVRSRGLGDVYKRQVMLNLLDNAAKFVGEDQPPRIEVGVAKDRPAPSFLSLIHI